MIENLDLSDEIENAINDVESEEEIAAEYVEQCLSDECLSEEYSVIKRIADYLSDKPCCSRKCCSTWGKNHLDKHSEDMKQL